MGTDRKWEDLDVDCLANIFARVGLESLIDGVPYVCKSWYRATLSPLCWQSIIFPVSSPVEISLCHLESTSASFRNLYSKWKLWNLFGRQLVHSAEAFLKFVIRRSHGSLTVLVIPRSLYLTDGMLKCIGDGCPSLKRLVLPDDGTYMLQLSSVICKWKNLEALEICRCYSLEAIIREINIHCKTFASLTVGRDTIDESDAYALTTLPNIEFLSLWWSSISRSNLLIILKGCKKLVYFDAGLWMGFVVDEEIKNLAAHIASFDYIALKVEQGAVYFDHETGYDDSDDDYDYGDGCDGDRFDDSDHEYWPDF